MRASRQNLTERQKEVLAVIYKYIKSSGFPPSLADLREELKISSNQSVLDLLSALEKKKCIKRLDGAARAIRILPQGYKVLELNPLVPQAGVVAAGPFIEAIEQVDTWQEVSPEIDKLENVFFVKIRGDSMIGAGIDDGDLVLVQERNEFSNGKIVLAETPCDGYTIKRLIVQNKSPYKYLKPENPNHKIIVFTKNVRLRGVALKVFKSDGSIFDLR